MEHFKDQCNDFYRFLVALKASIHEKRKMTLKLI